MRGDDEQVRHNRWDSLTSSPGMATQDPQRLVEQLDAPADRPVERLDVREMGPPAPLKEDSGDAR